MKKIIQYIHYFFYGFGLGVFTYTILSQILCPEKFSINDIWAVALMVAVIILAELLIFRTGISSKKSLWLRRMAFIGITCIITTGSMLLFGWFKPDSILTFFTLSVIINTVLLVISYVILDKIEKQNIEKINAKLKDNNQ